LKTNDKNVFIRSITSRKGFVALVVFIVGIIFTIGVVISAIKGSLTWDQAQNKIVAAFIAFTASAMMAQNGWSKEDAAEKGKNVKTDNE